MKDEIKGAGQDKPTAPDEKAHTTGHVDRLACGCRADRKNPTWTCSNDFMQINGQRIGIQLIVCTGCKLPLSIGAIQIQQPLIATPGPKLIPPR